MSYVLFKVLHLLGAFYLFAALGAVVVRRLDGSAGATKDRGHKLAGMTHGLALLVVPIAGFALLGIRGYGFELWVWLKLAIWLLLGGSLALVRRSERWASLFWWLLPLLGAVAAWLCVSNVG